MCRHVAGEHVVAVLPQQLPRVGVEAHDPFLLGGARSGSVLEIEVIAEDDRARSSAVGNLPGEVLATGRPFRGESCLGRYATARRSSPVGPIGSRSALRGGKRQRDHEPERGELHNRGSHRSPNDSFQLALSECHSQRESKGFQLVIPSLVTEERQSALTTETLETGNWLLATDSCTHYA